MYIMHSSTMIIGPMAFQQQEDFELELNESELLRVPADFTHDDAVLCEAVKRMDTKLHACPHCGMRLIGEATLNIHKNEKHKIFSKDNDAVEGKLR
jgi:hypothetical protein